MTRSEFLVTRRSLVERLGDWNDGKRWQQFFDSYWKLIHRTARKAGLTESEAQEVVQETLITVELLTSYRNVVDRSERDVIYGIRCVLVSEPEAL